MQDAIVLPPHPPWLMMVNRGNMEGYYLAQKRLFPGDLQERIKKFSDWTPP